MVWVNWLDKIPNGDSDPGLSPSDLVDFLSQPNGDLDLGPPIDLVEARAPNWLLLLC